MGYFYIYNEEKPDKWSVTMSKIIFSKNEQKQLAANPYVESVSEKGITYKDEFKRLFISQYEKGKLPRAIFEQAGFNVEILGIERIKSASKRWRTAYHKDGVLGLEDNRKHASGRPSTRERSLEEKYERLQAKLALVQAENELLKKLEMEERRLNKKKRY